MLLAKQQVAKLSFCAVKWIPDQGFRVQSKLAAGLWDEWMNVFKDNVKTCPEYYFCHPVPPYSSTAQSANTNFTLLTGCFSRAVCHSPTLLCNSPFINSANETLHQIPDCCGHFSLLDSTELFVVGSSHLVQAVWQKNKMLCACLGD